ncbi:hypothetical protein F511_28485 [Dorcoceras hygrometricum]|uniref:Uncharacterized protein n=1 Tax=Dorcoceras hygrometricum TaxID=472368 RepID=A0A2Z7A5D0_9LAMI|nr:hypothetical protein F511_28485 [Dorcoceras hygrometricum]
MTFRVVRTNQYNQDLRLIHSTNGNHLECPNKGSSIDHQVTIYQHAQNITMFPTNETCDSRPSSPLQTPPPPPAVRRRRKFVSGQLDEENPFVQNSSVLLVQPDEGISVLVVDRIGDFLPQSTEKSRVLVIPVGSRHKCQQDLEIGRPAAAVHGGPLISASRALARTGRVFGRALAARLPHEGRREMLQQAQEVAPTSGALAALCAADDGRRLSRFVSCGHACVALLAARCRLLDAPLGRRCATLACVMLRPGTPCVAREFFMWRSPAGRCSGAAPASLRRCRDGWSEFF